MIVEQENMSTKRWIVTYTKHMKQKRKVYQDGVLEVCSSTGKPQVILYDDYDKVIDRRFLKKEEIVKSGGTLSFEIHIVDVGDPDENKKASAESNVKSVLQRESPKEKLCVEWNVLYTMHMTQKAKKYHDGILRVLICSSHLNLITLLNEDGTILSSKYLKSVACLQTGKNCEFPNYLVEIGERRDSAPGQDEDIIGNHIIEVEGYSNVRSFRKDFRKDFHEKDFINQVLPSKPEKCDKLVTSRKDCKIPPCIVPKKEPSGWRTSNASNSVAPSNLSKDHYKKVTSNCNLDFGSFSNSSTATLRDACQILSVLKKRSPEGRLVLSDPFVEQGLASQSLDKCPLDLQTSSEKTGMSACYGLKSVNSQEDCMSAAHLMLDADCGGFSSENDFTYSILSSGTVALDTSTKCIINNNGGEADLKTKVSEVLGDPMLPGSSQSNKPDKPISDIGFSPEVIHDMKSIVPSRNTLGALNGKEHLSASTSIRTLLKGNLDANESSLHGMDSGVSSDSTPDQLCAKASNTAEIFESVSSPTAASTVHATSDCTKDPFIPSSVELTNVDTFPTFDLAL